MDPDDNAIVNTRTQDGQDETHVVLFEYTYSNGDKGGSTEHFIQVRKVQGRT
jgi:hypothetical protein